MKNKTIAPKNAEKTYDVFFNNNHSSDSKGFKSTLDYCKSYITMHNGSNESYFADYKNGNVSIVCNETEETVFETKITNKTVYGTICNHGSSQILEAFLPSGKHYTESGDITNDLDNAFELEMLDIDGTPINIIAEWSNK